MNYRAGALLGGDATKANAASRRHGTVCVAMVVTEAAA